MQAPIETRSSIISIDEEGILHIHIKDGMQVELEDAKESFAIYKKWGCDKNNVLQLMQGGKFYAMSKPAQKYATEQSVHFFIASALVNKSLAIRILFDFYLSFFKPKIPFKLFPTVASALKWLRSFKK